MYSCIVVQRIHIPNENNVSKTFVLWTAVLLYTLIQSFWCYIMYQCQELKKIKLFSPPFLSKAKPLCGCDIKISQSQFLIGSPTDVDIIFLDILKDFLEKVKRQKEMSK